MMKAATRATVLLFAILTLSGCCGRGLWYSSPSRSCAIAAETLPA